MSLTVSAIVVSYNQERWLREALDSVAAQTRAPDQVILVDDGSTDSCREIALTWAQEHRPDAHLVLRTDNRGVLRTLNEAFALATCDLIAPLAGDDLWLPQKLEVQVSQMAELPADVAVVYGDVPLVDEDSLPLPSTFIESYKGRVIQPEGEIFQELIWGNFIPSPSVLLRRASWQELGGFDESMYAEDWDFWLRLSRRFLFAYTKTPVAKYRVVANSYVRRGGTAALLGHLNTLRKWARTPELREPSTRRELRALAAYVLKQDDLAPKDRRRALAAWWRHGGARLVRHGRRPSSDTGGGYVLWVTCHRTESRPAWDMRSRLIRALGEIERVRVFVLGPDGSNDARHLAELPGVEHVSEPGGGGRRSRIALRALLRLWPVEAASSVSKETRRAVRAAALDGAVIVVDDPALLPVLPRGHLFLGLSDAEGSASNAQKNRVSSTVQRGWDKLARARFERVGHAPLNREASSLDAMQLRADVAKARRRPTS